MTKIAITFITLVIIIGAAFAIRSHTATAPSAQNTSTDTASNNPQEQETGNSAPRETTNPEAAKGTVITAKIGQEISLFGAKGSVTELIEDSRCPIDVQCIQAGTVRIKVHAGYGALSQDATLKLGTPYSLAGHSITLVSVSPEKKSSTTINASDYIFSFEIR
jgi:cell wall-associated NlpC family hydrolase